mmetsp:Transcript_94294/g.249289  ORF Transcript_94294/g.249289 Transcript_94294/m.249289 type:complete len:440 (+) Transcript_94294:166-1485(+)
MGQASGKVDDHFFLQKVKLGEGSFGTVWRAVDRQSKETVAVKQLEKATMPRRGVRQQDIENEIQVMRAVEHRNVTKLLAHFEDSDNIWIALEYCDGGDFGDKVKERGATLLEHEAADWMRQILDAIKALHVNGICHRDIKPDNFMVHGDQLKLSDFGLALFLPAGKLAAEKCGTPAFMSPEMHRLPRYSRGYTNLCDVWAAGVTMYMVMTGGKHPFLSDGAQEQQQLDERKLHSGALDFSLAESGFFGFAAGSRWCEAAKGCCRRMVEPDMARRATVQEVLTHEWLRRGEKTQTTRSPLGQVARLVRQGTLELSMPTKERSGASAGSLLERGTRCRYHSARYGWMPAVVQSFNESDGTYNLDVRDHARLRDMSPDSTVSAADAWPAYTLVHYQSETLSTWLPAMVRSFNEPKAGAEGSYNLDVRDFASIERIRPRLGLE